jgi:predicted nucleic acid-binding protein
MEDNRRLENDLLIDTNIFLSFLNREASSPWQESLELIDRIAHGDIHAFVTRFTLHTIAVKVAHQRKPARLEELSSFLTRIDQARGLSVYDTSTIEEKSIIDLMKTIPLDFDDALQYYIATQLGLLLVSFDPDFDKTDLSRVEPSAILTQTTA